MIMHYKYWTVAKSIGDTINLKIDPVSAFNNVNEYNNLLANTDRLIIWFALLYVVIEGYMELKLKDTQIDELLEKDDYVFLLKRFRNSVFHFQKEGITEKMMNFLEKENSKEWITALNNSFDAFFINSFPMHKPIEELIKSGFIKKFDNNKGIVYI